MTDEQTPDPHAALIAKLDYVQDHPSDDHEFYVLLDEARDALVQERARAERFKADRASAEEYTKKAEARAHAAEPRIAAVQEHREKWMARALAAEARADIAEKEAQLARENYSKEAQQEKARADRLAAIVREARSSGGWDAVAVLAQAEAEGLLFRQTLLDERDTTMTDSNFKSQTIVPECSDESCVLVGRHDGPHWMWYERRSSGEKRWAPVTDADEREAWTPSTEQVRAHYVFDQSDRWDSARGEAFDRWLAAQRAEWERGAAAEERRKIADEVTEWLDWYPTDIFIPGGTSVDARSADVIRVIVPNIAAAIRAEGTE